MADGERHDGQTGTRDRTTVTLAPVIPVSPALVDQHPAPPTRRRRRGGPWRQRGEQLSRRAAAVRTRALFLLMDAAVVVAAYGIASVVLLREHAPSHWWHRAALFVAVALVVHLAANNLAGLYGRIWRHAGIEEARNVVLACAGALGALLLAYPVGHALRLTAVPVGVLPLGCALTTLGVGLLRFQSRLLGWQRGARRMGTRVAVVGSRDAGAAVVREMLRSPAAGLSPVAVFDDDPRSHGLSLMGIPVVGAVDDLPLVAERLGIQLLLLAVPAPPRGLVERCLRAAEAAGVALKVVPGVREVVGRSNSSVSVRSAREPRIEDLLGRKQVATDLAAVRQSLHGRRVLVTGAGGSIGSEICRQVAAFGPAQLLLVDRDETHLHDVAGMLPGEAEQVLLDVADRRAVEELFERTRPDVVFHAAANKHVPILERHAVEAATTNVFGSLNVMEAAGAAGTERFVFVSTDKAVRPVSVMGATKHVGEQILLDRAPAGAAFCAVRFGNVLGSRGSVIPTFRRQIAAGGPVTVTDPRVTRFFMSVEEAVQLVLQASVLADGGDVFMLEMGEPVRILDLAQRMIRLSGFTPGTDIAIRISGLRPGEKLHEELRTPDDEVLPTAHPSIQRLLPGRVTPAALQQGLHELAAAVRQRDEAGARSAIFSMVAMPDGGALTGAAFRPLPLTPAAASA